MTMSNEPDIRIALTGDSLITRRITGFRDEPTQQLMNFIRSADVGFGNLEVVPNDFRGYPVEESGGAHLGAHSSVLDDMTAAGINLMAAANNHSLNYSIEGLLTAIDELQARDITFAGIGRNLAEARMPGYLDVDAGSVALIACASTFARGQQASEQRPDLPGRPGLNPLRFNTTYRLPADQIEWLRSIAIGLGLEERRLEAIQSGHRFPPADPDVFPFLEGSFAPGDDYAIETSPNKRDVEEIATWVQEARWRADVVIVSLHAHEQGATREDPADFIIEFAHRMIDEGADMVVGHGPHMLRGIEIYQGKPIFYSLGNFVGQNELTHLLPSDYYETTRIDPSVTPGQLFRVRSQGDQRGFPADIRYWQTVVPLCHYSGRELTKITIQPVSLGLGEAHHRRGRPRLAQGDEALDILGRLERLSRDMGTRFEREGQTLRLLF
jgi:poly-gamma-glutamate capsule biosynthesis protein CapA/YwtB (metallophosphatase superfamily)